MRYRAIVPRICILYELSLNTTGCIKKNTAQDDPSSHRSIIHQLYTEAEDPSLRGRG